MKILFSGTSCGFQRHVRSFRLVRLGWYDFMIPVMKDK